MVIFIRQTGERSWGESLIVFSGNWWGEPVRSNADRRQRTSLVRSICPTSYALKSMFIGWDEAEHEK